VFDDATPFDETLSTLNSLVTSGKVRFIGASNYTGWQLQKSIDLSRHHGWEPFVSLQPLYNLLDRGAELELLPVCRNEGVGVIAWSPLAGGWLSGKYTRTLDGPPADARANDEDWASRNNDRTWRVIETVQAVAAEVDRTPAQVALRWVLQQPGMTGPIIGARTPEQLTDNLKSTGWALDEDQIRRLTEGGDEPLPYPTNCNGCPSSFGARPDSGAHVSVGPPGHVCGRVRHPRRPWHNNALPW
jgi:aryl-alcohol dehydrogenase-like predicted oxidoreductase